MGQKLSYYQLLSNDPVYIGIGHIKPPTVSERRILGEHLWWQYIMYCSLTVDNYYQAFLKDKYDDFLSAPLEERKAVTLFDLLKYNEDVISVFVEIFNFYFIENVDFDLNEKVFRIFNLKYTDSETLSDKEIVGFITGETFQDVLDIILQISNVKLEKTAEDELSKVDDPVTLAWLKQREAAMKKRTPKKSTAKQDPKFDIGNIVSIVSAYGENGLNCLNIDNVTIPQLYDQLTRILIDRNYKIQARNVSIWGDENNEFQSDIYIKNINQEN